LPGTIDVAPPTEAHSKRLPPPEREAYAIVEGLAVGDVVTREPLWRMNDAMGDVKVRLEEESVRLGWLTQRPTPIITRWLVIGGAELAAAVGLAWLGYAIPMSGLMLVGAAMAVGGIGTAAFGSAMSQRTPRGAYVDAMLKAYRRTLQKTMDQARNMGEVVAQPEVRVLADTPDKAVVWGIALGLRREVAGVLERGDESHFAYGRQIVSFWRSLCGLTRVVTARDSVALDTKVTLYTIGWSFTAEFALKGVYEKTVGRAFEWLRGPGQTAEDQFVARDMKAYAAFLDNKTS